jgi:glutathione S-transferase
MSQRYQLYYSSGACSMAVHVLLNELNQSVELIDTSISQQKNKSAEFLKINPRGEVPVLVDNGTVITEGGAIITYVCDGNPSPLFPKADAGVSRAKALEALMFCNASLHVAYSKAFMIGRATIDQASKEVLSKQICDSIQNLWNFCDEKLASQKYLAGDTFTAADILMTVIANWNGWLPQPITLGPNVKRVIREVSARPAYQKALEIEGVEYKAAA